METATENNRKFTLSRLDSLLAVMSKIADATCACDSAKVCDMHMLVRFIRSHADDIEQGYWQYVWASDQPQHEEE